MHERVADIQTPGPMPGDVTGNRAKAWSELELASFVDSRVNAVLESRSIRLVDNSKEARMKRLALYGGLGLGGAAIGTAVTLGVQKIRRNRAAAGPRVTVK